MKDQRGVVYAETLVAFLPIFAFFLATIQLADVGAAHLVVQHASTTAARAAAVVLPDDGAYYGDRDNAAVNQFTGLRRVDIEDAADLILRVNGRLDRAGANVSLDKQSYAQRDDLTATVRANFECLIPVFCGGGIQMTGESKLVYQGARFIYEPTEIGDVVNRNPRDPGQPVSAAPGSNDPNNPNDPNDPNDPANPDDPAADPNGNGSPNDRNTDPRDDRYAGNDPANPPDRGDEPGAQDPSRGPGDTASRSPNDPSTRPPSGTPNDPRVSQGDPPRSGSGSPDGTSGSRGDQSSGTSRNPPGRDVTNPPNPSDQGVATGPTRPGPSVGSGNARDRTTPEAPPSDPNRDDVMPPAVADNDHRSPVDDTSQGGAGRPGGAPGTGDGQGAQAPRGPPGVDLTKPGDQTDPAAVATGTAGNGHRDSNGSRDDGSRDSNGSRENGLQENGSRDNGVVWTDENGRRRLPVLNPACFVAGTLVHTAEGDRPIESIRVGELVWSRDERTGEQALKAVTRVFITPDQPVLDLELHGEYGAEHIGATPNHPFWVEHVGWVSAESLGATALLWSPDGALAGHAGAAWGERTKVYNLEVADFHTYFVGALHAWVHNACEDWGAEPARGWTRGERQAQARDWPPAPDGYHWVASSQGPYIRRSGNGSESEGSTPLRYDPRTGEFVPDTDRSPTLDANYHRTGLSREEEVELDRLRNIPRADRTPAQSERLTQLRRKGAPIDFNREYGAAIASSSGPGLSRSEQRELDRLESRPPSARSDAENQRARELRARAAADALRRRNDPNLRQHEQTTATEQLGEIAADEFVATAFPNARRVSAGNGPGELDRVYENGDPPPAFIIVEAKGGSATNTSARNDGDERLQQGRRDYLESVLRNENSKMSPELRDRLRMALDRPQEVVYLEVTQPVTDDNKLGPIKVREYLPD